MKTANAVNIGIIGAGYWGPKLLRNFLSLANCNVKCISDLKSGRLDFIRKEFPYVDTTDEYSEIINDKTINAVCIATPVTTHKKIAEEAILAGKHVFVEKPMTSSIEEAESLLKTAAKHNKKLAVGHVFQFAPAVRKIKELLDAKTIGEVLHITSTRINLGPPESEVDVIWDLGPHDFSILLYLLNQSAHKISSFTNAYPFNAHNNPANGNPVKKLINNAHIDLCFNNNVTAHIHLSWLSSNKIRLMQIFGTEGTIVYDEMLALDGKVKLYGKGIDNRINSKVSDTTNLSYQSGDIYVLTLEQHEPLRMECEHFINSIINDTELINDGKMGLEVVKLLEYSSNQRNKGLI
jgi:predicted dehydrogenase